MALPVAPLGSMPNINLPYNVPSNQRRRNVLEEAIAAMLVGAAGAAGQQAIGNVMTREQVDTFNKLDPNEQRQNPSWWQHLMQGPGASGADVQKKRAEMTETERFNQQLGLQERQVGAEEGRLTETKRANETAEQRNERLDKEAREAAMFKRIQDTLALQDALQTSEATRGKLDVETNAAAALTDPSLRRAKAEASSAEAMASPERQALEADQTRAYSEYLRSGAGQRQAGAEATSAKTENQKQFQRLIQQRLQQMGIKTPIGLDVPPIQGRSFTESDELPVTTERPLGSDVSPEVIDLVVKSNPPIPQPVGGVVPSMGTYGPLSGAGAGLRVLDMLGMIPQATPAAAQVPAVNPEQIVQVVEQFIATQGATPTNIQYANQLLSSVGLTIDDLPSLNQPAP